MTKFTKNSHFLEKNMIFVVSRQPEGIKPLSNQDNKTMKVGFGTIHTQVIPMEQFRMKWRFTEQQYRQLPVLHLEQLKPLSKEASRFLWDFISVADLHHPVPFKEGFFKTIDKVKILEGNDKEIKKWLYQKGLPFEKEVFLSWQPDEAMIVPWKLLIKYFDSFYYGASDDLSSTKAYTGRSCFTTKMNYTLVLMKYFSPAHPSKIQILFGEKKLK